MADLEVVPAKVEVMSDAKSTEGDDASVTSCKSTTENADVLPQNYSFSLFDETLDQSSLIPSNLQHDVSTGSHDLFDQSHDSFDELIRHVSSDAPESSRNTTETTEVTSNTTEGALGLSDDITRGSHDLSRHLVLEAVVQEWEGGGGRARPELMLRLLDQSTLKESVVYLRDEW